MSDMTGSGDPNTVFVYNVRLLVNNAGSAWRREVALDRAFCPGYFSLRRSASLKLESVQTRMPPRGLRKLLKDTAPCKLVGKGVTKHFEIKGQSTGSGLKLKGLTKRLYTHIFSDGELPSIAKSSARPAGGHWRGPGGGRKRGSAVDAQVSRLANLTFEKRSTSKMLNLTKLVFAALAVRGLEPIMGQRAVCSQLHRVGTAADIVCYDGANNAVVVVELKCGHSGARTAAAVKCGQPCVMQSPLQKAADSTLHRHMCQLAVTHHLLTKEANLITKLNNMGVESVQGALVYANDASVDVYPLESWWIKRASRILTKLA